MSSLPPTIRPPTPDDLRDLAAQHYLDLSDEEVDDFGTLVERELALFERLDELPAPAPPRADATRDSGYHPDREEDPHNAFVTRCRVSAGEAGPLAGVTVALKDNVAVAGVEMTCGSRLLEGYVPLGDATVVRRLLAAGATVVGKANMEDLAVSGGSELSSTGTVLNPRAPDHLAGGSSSGSAAAVAAGDADVALGTDQAGSVRIPAAWCGVVGHKPTHGLVPYTGVVGLGHTFDHVGPLARNVEDCARVLDAIAGPDPDDPRQAAAPEPEAYLEAVRAPLDDLSIGAVAEGFDRDEADPGVTGAVRDALDAVAGDGVAVDDASVPWHRDGLAVWSGVASEATAALVRAEGVGHFVEGRYDGQFAVAFGRARRAAADELPPTMKLRLLLGQYLMDRYRGRYHAKAQNLRGELRAAYDAALADVDVLAMPTVPTLPPAVVEEATRLELFERARGMAGNTAPFDVTGHPAVSVPCGTVDGLPVGLMLVGRRFEDAAVLRAARAVEERVDPGFA